jgi:hypothetical protein
MLIHSPTPLFVIPGALLCLVGVVALTAVTGGLDLFGRQWQMHTLTAGALLFLAGIQVLGLGVCARAYGTYVLGEPDPVFHELRRRFRLEHGLLLGAAGCTIGITLGLVVLAKWLERGLGELSEERLALLAATLVLAGAQVIFVSFLLSILGLRHRDAPAVPEAPLAVAGGEEHAQSGSPQHAVLPAPGGASSS